MIHGYLGRCYLWKMLLRDALGEELGSEGRGALEQAKHVAALKMLIALDPLSKLHVLTSQVSDVALLVLVDVGHTVKFALELGLVVDWDYNWCWSYRLNSRFE